jgi:hypothetical protein
MCGEHYPLEGLDVEIAGSSPHVRGAPFALGDQSGNHRIIPACAGSTIVADDNLIKRQDHPRMCGEHYAHNK